MYSSLAHCFIHTVHVYQLWELYRYLNTFGVCKPTTDIKLSIGIVADMTSWLGRCREQKGLRTQYAGSCGYEFLIIDKCEKDMCLRIQCAGSSGYEFLVTHV